MERARFDGLIQSAPLTRRREPHRSGAKRTLSYEFPAKKNPEKER